MTRQQVILIIGAVLAIVLLAQLPRVVVHNEPEAGVAMQHNFSMSAEDEARFAALYQQLNEASDLEKIINFADSLASLALKYQLLDTAVYMAGIIEERDTTETGAWRAAQVYYRAYQQAQDAAQAASLATKARERFQHWLEVHPEDLSVKSKLAMTMVVTDSPMVGIQLLREVLAERPDFREALLNLGLLSIKSGQFDRAVERFTELLALDSTDWEARLYLGVSLAETGKTEEAKQELEKVVNHPAADAAIRATASGYIQEL